MPHRQPACSETHLPAPTRLDRATGIHQPAEGQLAHDAPRHDAPRHRHLHILRRRLARRQACPRLLQLCRTMTARVSVGIGLLAGGAEVYGLLDAQPPNLGVAAGGGCGGGIGGGAALLSADAAFALAAALLLHLLLGMLLLLLLRSLARPAGVRRGSEDRPRDAWAGGSAHPPWMNLQDAFCRASQCSQSAGSGTAAHSAQGGNSQQHISTQDPRRLYRRREH